MLTRDVTDQERRAFGNDGVVLLRGIYPTRWVETLRACLEEVFEQSAVRKSVHGDGVLHGKSEHGSASDMVDVLKDSMRRNPGLRLAIEGDCTLDDVAGASYVETDAAHWHAPSRAHHLEGPLPEILSALTGSRTINFYSDQLFYKGPGSLVKTPFHQDKPYFLVDGGDVAVAWVPVDRVDAENGAMGYVKGSHLWGKTFKPSDFRTDTGTFPEVGGIDFTGLDTLDHSLLESSAITYFDAEPGDVIVHHWATLHGSRGNVSATRVRRAASVRYALEGCRYFQRPSSPEPFRHTVGLRDGDPLELSPRFPIVWPR